MSYRLHTCVHSYASKLVPIFYYRDKTRVHTFYFLILRCVLALRVFTELSILKGQHDYISL